MVQIPVPATDNGKKRGLNKGKLFLVLFLAGLFFIFLGINLYVIVPVSVGNEAEACARCHAMVPEYATWRESNHAQFQCRDCHKQPGFAHLLKYQTRMVKEFLFYRATDMPQTVVADKIPDEVCKQCHSSNRIVSASSDTIIPHQKHEEKGISCVTCHKGVAHGRIMERGMTRKLTVSEWTPDVAREQMDYKYTTPKMDICLDCHGKRNVETTCSVCHSSMPIPDSHKPANWMTKHGEQARQDFKPCNLCHVYTMKKEVDLLQTTVFGYIRINTFCMNCHTTKKPPSHRQEGFMARHGTEAKNKGTGNCFVCHNLNKEDAQKGGWPNKVNCNDCHWFKAKSRVQE
ncbi:putative multiheme cytochrome c [Thermincola ferriacetica]|uniref:Putative multiheme cytochrome c n=1 Tax=Thermincola ferriacetica TaxID=281456 RepID=A0A0L6W6F0_9FIRM|nr:NapC/NirT family cytochrome c [Thermincola ferriacetica]KNZ70943.1 putative multiheme cytochrome c [Thermincola ferriacetica]